MSNAENSFRFYLPIEIRYGDIDPQRHVNNARFFSFMEDARSKYLQHLKLWDGKDFDEIGIILLETRCTFRAPIAYGQAIRVGVRTVRLGNKSLEMEYCIEEDVSGKVLAVGTSIAVAYDYPASRSIPIPEDWRKTLQDFEESDLRKAQPD
jgi:acyl-CoA thioester hydrolase